MAIDTVFEALGLANLVICVILFSLLLPQWFYGRRARQRHKKIHGRRKGRRRKNSKSNLLQALRRLNLLAVIFQSVQSTLLFSQDDAPFAARSIGGDLSQISLLFALYMVVKRYLAVALTAAKHDMKMTQHVLLTGPMVFIISSTIVSAVVTIVFNRRWYEFINWFTGALSLPVWCTVTYVSLRSVDAILKKANQSFYGQTPDKDPTIKAFKNAKVVFRLMLVLTAVAFPFWVLGGITILQDKDERYFPSEDQDWSSVIGPLSRWVGMMAIAWFAWTPMSASKQATEDYDSDRDPNGKSTQISSTAGSMNNLYSQGESARNLVVSGRTVESPKKHKMGTKGKARQSNRANVGSHV